MMEYRFSSSVVIVAVRMVRYSDGLGIVGFNGQRNGNVRTLCEGATVRPLCDCDIWPGYNVLVEIRGNDCELGAYYLADCRTVEGVAA